MERRTIGLQNPATWLFLFYLLSLAGCASTPEKAARLYLPAPPPELQSLHVPAFLADDGERPFNRIGTPVARAQVEPPPLIVVDPESASLYFEAQEFTTAKGTYTNLVYRLHFSEVPFKWNSPHLTAGANPGLLIIYTLDERSTLLLVTTVHTCGCYLAFLPTSAMPARFLPENWSSQPQEVYGQTLPGLLPLPAESSASRLLFSLESETHRIRDAALFPSTALERLTPRQGMALRPMIDLYYLPYQGKTVSFFESEGSRRGYVKNNSKILERLLMSWWAFDLYIGEDKAFSQHDQSEVPLYTSLKFWARKASDLKNFPQFLEYWGWRL